MLACVDIACTSTIARCLIVVAFSEKCAETWVMTNGKPASVEASTYYVLLLLKSNVIRCSESKYWLQVPSNMPRPAFRVDCERSGLPHRGVGPEHINLLSVFTSSHCQLLIDTSRQFWSECVSLHQASRISCPLDSTVTICLCAQCSSLLYSTLLELSATFLKPTQHVLTSFL